MSCFRIWISKRAQGKALSPWSEKMLTTFSITYPLHLQAMKWKITTNFMFSRRAQLRDRNGIFFGNNSHQPLPLSTAGSFRFPSPEVCRFRCRWLASTLPPRPETSEEIELGWERDFLISKTFEYFAHRFFSSKAIRQRTARGLPKWKYQGRKETKERKTSTLWNM